MADDKREIIRVPGYDGPDRRTTSEELAETRDALNRLTGALTGFLPREDAIRQHQHATRQRRALVCSLILVIMVTFLAMGFHTDHCSPGSRIAPAMDEFAGGTLEPGELKEILSRDAPVLCEVMQPLSRGYDADWPSTANIVGGVLFASILIGLIAWLFTPVRIPPELRAAEPGDDVDPAIVESSRSA